MKIAILFSGRTQQYESSFRENLKNLIEPLSNSGYDVHLYGSFWSEHSTYSFIKEYESWWKLYDIESLTDYTGGVIKDFNEYNKLVKQYNPNEEQVLINTMYWLYKLDRTYQLVKQYELVNNFTYDYYIRMRPDVNLENPINVESLKELTDTSIITHVDRIVHKNDMVYGYREGWIDDNYCIAKKPIFEMYCGVYRNLITLVEKYQNCIIHVILQRLFEEHKVTTLQPSTPIVMHKNRGDHVLDIVLFAHTYEDIDLRKYNW